MGEKKEKDRKVKKGKNLEIKSEEKRIRKAEHFEKEK